MNQRNVLIVEDDDTIRRLLVEYFGRRPSLTVEAARDGIEALHHVTTRPYRVVVLDVVMPKMSGVDFLESLKAMAADPSVKSVEQVPAVLVITATPEEVLPAEAIEQRFPDLVRGVFRKPIDVVDLARSVERQLARC